MSRAKSVHLGRVALRSANHPRKPPELLSYLKSAGACMSQSALMNLTLQVRFPARGLKHSSLQILDSHFLIVASTLPRKGTETGFETPIKQLKLKALQVRFPARRLLFKHN
jgi:hypothetical protein